MQQKRLPCETEFSITRLKYRLNDCYQLPSPTQRPRDKLCNKIIKSHPVVLNQIELLVVLL